MIILLILLNVASVAGCIYLNCFNRKGIEINHTFLFGIGFLYYWMLPVIVGEFGLFQESPAMGLWHSIYNNILPANLIKYLFFSLAFSIAFYFGNFIGKRVFVKVKNANSTLRLDRKILYALLLALCPLLIYYVLHFRGSFFAFYQNEINLSNEKGQFVSLSLVLLSMALMYSVERERRLTRPTFANVTKNPFIIIYLCVSLLILTMGGRLYLLSSLIMLLVYRSVYFEPLKRKTTYLFFATFIVIMGVIGVFRLGTTNITSEGVLFNVVAEPLYTGFSLISFIEDNRIELFNFPVFLVTEFLNLIPSSIFPNKAQLFLAPQDYGYVLYSPLGAMSSFVSFMVNFGMIGSVMTIFLFSFVMNYLKKKSNNRLLKVMYIMISGWIPFSFFRDPFSVSIVKQMFQFSFFVPLLIIGTVLFISNVPSISLKNRTVQQKN